MRPSGCCVIWRPHHSISDYQEALPILGVDGTLRTVVDADSPAKGQVRAKTGTYFLDNGLNGKWILTSKALAGYIDAASGAQDRFCRLCERDVSGDG